MNPVGFCSFRFRYREHSRPRSPMFAHRLLPALRLTRSDGQICSQRCVVVWPPLSVESRVVHGRAAGRFSRPRRCPSVGNPQGDAVFVFALRFSNSSGEQ